jgi:hypothetical protein
LQTEDRWQLLEEKFDRISAHFKGLEQSVGLINGLQNNVTERALENMNNNGLSNRSSMKEKGQYLDAISKVEAFEY